ncbi:MAG: FecR domain-containing protein [Alphaproteobacteria bacterium]|nr:FecR domain-containing protein [Alphaproteobacteria bacterium]
MTSVGRIVLLLFFALWSAGLGRSAGAQIIGTVTGLAGTASLQRPAAATPVPLVLRSEVQEGDILRTGPGARIRVTLRDDTVLLLGAEAELKLDHFATVPQPGGVGSLFSLARGYLRTVVGRLQPDTPFQIQSPSMVAAVRGTDWIERYDAGTTEIFVVNGRVLATGLADRDTNWAMLTAGEGVSFVIRAPHTPVVRWGEEKINRFVEATRVP